MIFLSYNHSDKEVVKEVAIQMAKSFGRNAVFFDEWSILPGDGIIDRMSSGLSDSQFFFFFVSKNSLASNMVKLEWQNALMKKAQNNDFLFVPVRLDNSVMPAVLLQVLYIDLYANGIDYAVRQMIDTVNHQSTSDLDKHSFSNLMAERQVINNGLTERITFSAKYYFEPTTQFVLFSTYKKGDFVISPDSCKSDGMYFSSGVVENSIIHGLNSLTIKVDRGLTPENPLIFDVSIKEKGESKIVLAVYHLKGPKSLDQVELIEKL